MGAADRHHHTLFPAGSAVSALADAVPAAGETLWCPYLLEGLPGFLPPGTQPLAAVVEAVQGGRVDRAQGRIAAFHQGNVHSELPVAGDKLLGPVQGVHQEESFPVLPLLVGDLCPFLGDDGDVRIEFAESCGDEVVGGPVGGGEGGVVGFVVHLELGFGGGAVDLHHGCSRLPGQGAEGGGLHTHVSALAHFSAPAHVSSPTSMPASCISALSRARTVSSFSSSGTR